MKTLVVSLIGVLLCVMPTLAQEDSFIAYGETVPGEITVSEYERRYSFEGSAGDLIRVALTPDSDLYHWSGWHKPEVLLLDSDKQVITALHAHESAVLIHELTQTGDYHLIATGWGGRSKDNVGKYQLSLERIPLLVEGEVTDCEASSQLGAHYAVRADGDFQIAYEHLGGKFRPEVSVNVIAEDPYSCGLDTPNCSSDASGANLHEVAVLSGVWLDSGVINVRAKPLAKGLFIVQVAKGEWDWDYHNEKSSAKFNLTLKTSDA